jgi:hypothetical protein
LLAFFGINGIYIGDKPDGFGLGRDVAFVPWRLTGASVDGITGYRFDDIRLPILMLDTFAALRHTDAPLEAYHLSIVLKK